MEGQSGLSDLSIISWVSAVEGLNCLLYGIAGCPLFRGCLSIEVNGRTVGTFRLVRYIMGVRS